MEFWSSLPLIIGIRFGIVDDLNKKRLIGSSKGTIEWSLMVMYLHHVIWCHIIPLSIIMLVTCMYVFEPLLYFVWLNVTCVATSHLSGQEFHSPKKAYSGIFKGFLILWL